MNATIYHLTFRHRLVQAWRVLWANAYVLVLFDRNAKTQCMTMDCTISEGFNAAGQIDQAATSFQAANEAVDELKALL